jgi:hypothetical protein
MARRPGGRKAPSRSTFRANRTPTKVLSNSAARHDPADLLSHVPPELALSASRSINTLFFAMVFMEDCSDVTEQDGSA